MADEAGELPEVHRRALEHTGRLVAGVGDDQWDLPTPCDDWDVRELVNHLVSENLWVAPMLEGRSIDDVGDAFEGDQLGDDPVAAYDRSAEIAGEAACRPGAMEQPVAVSYGPVPGADYTGHRLVDVVVHGWDLAAATGQDRSMDAEALEVLWPRLQSEAEMLASTPYFGDPVSVGDDAPLADRVLGLLGRDPTWAPPPEERA
jgi:uncharacterized protein (TIGR03086 family)